MFVIAMYDADDITYFNQATGWTFIINLAKNFDSHEDAFECLKDIISNQNYGHFQIQSYFVKSFV